MLRFAVFVSIFFSFRVSAAIVEGPALLGGSSIKIEGGRMGTVVVFLSSVCPCSQSHEDELKKLSREYAEFQFVGIHSNPDETAADAKAYFQKVGFTFPVISDFDQKLANRFRAIKTPHAFVLSKSGEILFQGGVSDSSRLGRANQLFLRQALSDVKSNLPVRTKLARALGCAIKRR